MKINKKTKYKHLNIGKTLQPQENNIIKDYTNKNKIISLKTLKVTPLTKLKSYPIKTLKNVVKKANNYIHSSTTINTTLTPLLKVKQFKKSIIKSKSTYPLTKEWNNGVYNYNINFNKNLPYADIIVRKLVKNLFNSRPLSHNYENKKLILSVRKILKFSLDKILISKPEIKHFRDRVNITIYLYNKKKNYLINKIKDTIHDISFLKNKFRGYTSIFNYKWKKKRFNRRKKMQKMQISAVLNIKQIFLSLKQKALYKKELSLKKKSTVNKVYKFKKKIAKGWASKKNKFPSLNVTPLKKKNPITHNIKGSLKTIPLSISKLALKKAKGFKFKDLVRNKKYKIKKAHILKIKKKLKRETLLLKKIQKMYRLKGKKKIDMLKKYKIKKTYMLKRKMYMLERKAYMLRKKTSLLTYLLKRKRLAGKLTKIISKVYFSKKSKYLSYKTYTSKKWQYKSYSDKKINWKKTNSQSKKYKLKKTNSQYKQKNLKVWGKGYTHPIPLYPMNKQIKSNIIPLLFNKKKAINKQKKFYISKKVKFKVITSASKIKRNLKSKNLVTSIYKTGITYKKNFFVRRYLKNIIFLNVLKTNLGVTPLKVGGKSQRLLSNNNKQKKILFSAITLKNINDYSDFLSLNNNKEITLKKITLKDFLKKKSTSKYKIYKGKSYKKGLLRYRGVALKKNIRIISKFSNIKNNRYIVYNINYLINKYKLNKGYTYRTNYQYFKSSDYNYSTYNNKKTNINKNKRKTHLLKSSINKKYKNNKSIISGLWLNNFLNSSSNKLNRQNINYSSYYLLIRRKRIIFNVLKKKYKIPFKLKKNCLYNLKNRLILFKLNKINEFINKYIETSNNSEMDNISSSCSVFDADKDLNVTPILSPLSSEDISYNENENNNIGRGLKNIYLFNYIKNVLVNEVLTIHYIRLLAYNNSLYKSWFLTPLKNMISRIYNKQIHFNFVNLKYLHLNSDILTQAIVIKLKNIKENKLSTILRKVLGLVVISRHNEYSENIFSPMYKFIEKHYNRYKTLNKIMRLSRWTTKFNKVNSNTLKKGITLKKEKLSSIKLNNPIVTHNIHKGKKFKWLSYPQSTTINLIKYKSTFGLKIITAGRLSKRATASRAQYKIKYLGNLQNNSLVSRNLKPKIIKSNIISNIQHSKLNSKTRTGAFGVKTWINNN